MKALIFQHTPEESPGTLLSWATERGIRTTVHHWYAGGPAPDATAFDLLFILGGPMNVDAIGGHPWLAQEKIFLRDWVAFQRPVMGICLGGQLLAQALGGTVARARAREIGFQEVSRTGAEAPAFARWPARLRVYQYHEDSFTLPPGCTSLLTSEGCEIQAFTRGKKAIGLQFHPESTAEWIQLNAASVIQAEGEEFVQTPAETAALVPEHLAPMTAAFHQLLDDFVESWA